MSATKLQPYHPFRSAEARDRYLAYYDKAAASWPVPSESVVVQTEHGSTFVRVSGPKDAPPLVLLPGVWSTSLMFSPNIEAFSREYRTYAVDNLYDFGRSVSARPAKTAAEHMSWLDGLFDGLGLTGGINIMGCSRGGWLVGEYLLHAPGRLVKAVLHSPAGVVIVNYWAGMKGGPYFGRVLMSPSTASVTALMLWLMPDFARTNPAGFDAYIEETVLGLRSYDAGVVGRAFGPRQFSDAELAGIDVPVLYIAGEKEKMYSPAAAVARLRSVAPRFETAVIPGGGHDIASVETDAFNARVLEFLRTERGSAAS